MMEAPSSRAHEPIEDWANLPEFVHCSNFLREADRALWLCGLFIPARHRGAVYALQAFATEVLGIRGKISEPMAGELRLQFFADALVALAQGGDAQSHPIMRALEKAVAAYHLPVAPLNALVEAARFELYDDPMPDEAGFEGWCGETQAAVLRLTTLVLLRDAPSITASETEALNEACGHSGVALGYMHMLQNWARAFARGSCPVPWTLVTNAGAPSDMLRDTSFPLPARAVFHAALAKARHHLAFGETAARRVPLSARAAFVPLSLIKPHLRLMANARYNPYKTRALSLMALQWHMWRFTRTL